MSTTTWKDRIQQKATISKVLSKTISSRYYAVYSNSEEAPILDREVELIGDAFRHVLAISSKWCIRAWKLSLVLKPKAPPTHTPSFQDAKGVSSVQEQRGSFFTAPATAGWLAPAPGRSLGDWLWPAEALQVHNFIRWECSALQERLRWDKRGGKSQGEEGRNGPSLWNHTKKMPFFRSKMSALSSSIRHGNSWWFVLKGHSKQMNVWHERQSMSTSNICWWANKDASKHLLPLDVFSNH